MSNNIKIELAKLIIEIENPNAYVIDKCKDYIVSAENTDIFIVKPTQNDIELERVVANKQRELDKLPTITFENDYLEYIHIYREIADRIPKFDVILMHAAAVAVDGKAYMFLAKSGTGKTTHIMNWKKTIPNTLVINGDKPLINSKDMTVCGTPWSGKENLNTNIQVPLAGLCILERGKNNRISRIEPWDAVKSINDETHWPSNSQMRKKTIEILNKLQTIPYYRLFCTPDCESAEMTYYKIKRDKE